MTGTKTGRTNALKKTDYQAFLERKDRGTVDIGHVRDEENPADFMTKYVPKAKYEASYKYATNAHNSVRA